MNYTSELQQIGLFEHLSENELRMLSTTLLEKPSSRGSVLFRQGDPALGCFVILSGEVGVFLGEPVAGSSPVAILKSGETVGHLALVDRQRRSAQCIVVSESARLAELRVDDFERLFNAQTPFAYKILDNLLKDLSARLRKTNETLLKASFNQKNELDGKTRKVLAHQLLERPAAKTNGIPTRLKSWACLSSTGLGVKTTKLS